MEVLRGVYLIKGEISNTYLVEAGGNYVLVDAGSPGDVGLIMSYIKSLGLKPEDVKYVLVTHAHWDHVGGLSKIKELTKAKVVAHSDEAPYVEVGGEGFDGVNVDVKLAGGELIAGLTAIHAPGHTPGNTCFLDGVRGVLFAGDLIYEEDGELHEMHHKYSRDPEGNRESIIKLMSYEFKHVLPSHGRPILNEGKEALKKLVASLKESRA